MSTCTACGASTTAYAERYTNANQPAAWCDPGAYQNCKYTASGEFMCDSTPFDPSYPTLSNPVVPSPTMAGVVANVANVAKKWWSGVSTTGNGATR